MAKVVGQASILRGASRELMQRVAFGLPHVLWSHLATWAEKWLRLTQTGGVWILKSVKTTNLPDVCSESFFSRSFGVPPFFLASQAVMALNNQVPPRFGNHQFVWEMVLFLYLRANDSISTSEACGQVVVCSAWTIHITFIQKPSGFVLSLWSCICTLWSIYILISRGLTCSE